MQNGIRRTRQVHSEWESPTLVPLHNKKDRKVSDKYQGISLLIVHDKVLVLTLKQLQTISEPQLMDTQYGFRRDTTQSTKHG